MVKSEVVRTYQQMKDLTDKEMSKIKNDKNVKELKEELIADGGANKLYHIVVDADSIFTRKNIYNMIKVFD